MAGSARSARIALACIIRQTPQAAEHHDKRHAVGDRGGDRGPVHADDRQQSDEQATVKTAASPCDHATTMGPIPASQEIADYPAAGQEDRRPA